MIDGALIAAARRDHLQRHDVDRVAVAVLHQKPDRAHRVAADEVSRPLARRGESRCEPGPGRDSDASPRIGRTNHMSRLSAPVRLTRTVERFATIAGVESSLDRLEFPGI